MIRYRTSTADLPCTVQPEAPNRYRTSTAAYVVAARETHASRFRTGGLHLLADNYDLMPTVVVGCPGGSPGLVIRRTRSQSHPSSAMAGASRTITCASPVAFSWSSTLLDATFESVWAGVAIKVLPFSALVRLPILEWLAVVIQTRKIHLFSCWSRKKSFVRAVFISEILAGFP